MSSDDGTMNFLHYHVRRSSDNTDLIVTSSERYAQTILELGRRLRGGPYK